MSKLQNIKAILLDIEGTTTPLDFVHQTLFPFAKERIGDFVRENFSDIEAELRQLAAEYRKDFLNQIYGRDFKPDSPESIAEYLRFLIEIDRKSTPLKSIQGKIWKKGYETGELKSEVFADVRPAFGRWQSLGKTIAIYSSGSVLAQKLLFENTGDGDLTQFISAYFDTNTGPKRIAGSYRKIAAVNGFPPVENFLFISDAAEELDAARKAGMLTRMALRDGNDPVRQKHTHPPVRSFDEVL